MRAVIFKTQYGVFKFDQKEVKEQIVQKKSAYDTDETDKLINLISTCNQENIVIPEEPVFFDSTTMDLINRQGFIVVRPYFRKRPLLFSNQLPKA